LLHNKQKYKSYAQLDGPHGITNTCASLSSNTASPLGGVCPNIKYGSAGGQALVGFQIGFVVYLMVVNIMELAKGYTASTNQSTSEEESERFEGKKQEDQTFISNISGNSAPPKSGPTKRPLSVYYQKRY